jgi:alkylation response protein AidB-like acyl-CoA dehydrogenase
VRLKETLEEQAFRRELRAWLDDTLPTLPPEPPFEDWAAKRAYDTGWQRRLFEAGYAGISWPKEYGGRGATPSEELIFLEETEKAGAPYVGCNFVSTLHAGPTIAAEGTPEQRARYLPPILRGDNVWCQGFSEPEAGSDLASLRTPRWRTTASCWPAPTPTPRSTAASPGWSCRWTRPGSPCGRCGR